MEKKTMFSDKDEEIDLISLFTKIRLVLRRTKLLFFALLVTGIALGVLYYNVAPKKYKSRMIISSSAFDGPTFVIILDNLKMLIEEGDYEGLASVLQIDLATAQKIKKLEIYSSRNYAEDEFGENVRFKDNKVLEMEDRREDFVIEAYAQDNSVFKILENGIVNYLNNNPSIKESSIIKQNALMEIKQSIHRERAALDTLKNSLAAILSEKGRTHDIFIGEPGAMYTGIVGLYQTEIRLDEALLASKINVLEGFRVYKKQDSPQLGISILGFTFVFMSLYVATVIFLEGNRKTKVA